MRASENNKTRNEGELGMDVFKTSGEKGVDINTEKNLDVYGQLSTSYFHPSLNKFRNEYRWMTIAGGIKPWRHPQIIIEKRHAVVDKREYFWIRLIKHGDGVSDFWLRKYYDCVSWAEKENALKHFSEALFGEFAEEMKEISNVEYIADHLIKFHGTSANEFTITGGCGEGFASFEEVKLFKRELEKTPIININ